ncbi:MAG: hypothetical protein EOP56_15135 [Sphingobacteriales bacterium]|nr:MAG: hypothetical protein EOP56_15135 [Sphingobacteriales bacterium]
MIQLEYRITLTWRGMEPGDSIQDFAPLFGEGHTDLTASNFKRGGKYAAAVRAVTPTTPCKPFSFEVPNGELSEEERAKRTATLRRLKIVLTWQVESLDDSIDELVPEIAATHLNLAHEQAVCQNYVNAVAAAIPQSARIKPTSAPIKQAAAGNSVIINNNIRLINSMNAMTVK